MSRINWTENLIEIGIREVMDAPCIDRMPTVSEIRKTRGDTTLCNKISQSGGYKHWAKKLDLQAKPSDTLFGTRYEGMIKGKLMNMGFEVELMSTKHPYDLLVNNNIKVDVKASRFYEPNNCHTFNLEKDKATCDIYVAVALDDEDVDRIFVIPSKFLKIRQLSIGRRSKYNRYADRWDYFKTYDDFYESLH